MQLISRYTTTIENENTLVSLFDMVKSRMNIETDETTKNLMFKSLKNIMLRKNKNLEILKTNVFLYSLETLKKEINPRVRLPFLVDLLRYFSKNHHKLGQIDLGMNKSQIINFLKNNTRIQPNVKKLSMTALIASLVITAYLEFESWKGSELEIEEPSIEKIDNLESIEGSVQGFSQIMTESNDLLNDDSTEEIVNSIFSGIKPIKNSKSDKSGLLTKVFTFTFKILNEDNTVKKLYYQIDRLIENLENFFDENQNFEIFEKNSNSFSNDVNLKEILLIVVSVLYFVHPSLFSHILSRVSELCYSNSDSFLRFKCLFYIKLLEKNSSQFEKFLKSLFENILV